MWYYLLFAVCYLISLLPFPLLYRLSDVLYGCIYYLIGYRKQLVRQHLLQAFPELDEPARRNIEKAYYRNLCDMVVETIKMMSLSPSSLQKRFQCDLSLLHRLARKVKAARFNWDTGSTGNGPICISNWAPPFPFWWCTCPSAIRMWKSW